MRSALQILLSLAIVAVMPAAFAQTYPSKPVAFVIPFPPGGGSDVLGRVIAQRLAERLNQQFVPENRGGAGGTVGATRVARAAPDGYTLLFTPQTPITIASNFQQKPAYDAAVDLVPVARAVISPVIAAVPPALGVRTLAEFADYAKKNPGKTFFGAPGLGNELHLMWEMLRAEMGLDTVTVPYQGAGPAVVDLLAGRIQIVLTAASTVKGYIADGRLRGLATVAEKRHPEFPDLPSLPESGLQNLSVPAVWWGLFAPAGTPPAVIDRLYREMEAITAEPAYRKRVVELGLEPAAANSAEFGAQVARGRTQWAAIIKSAHLKIDAQ